MINDRKVNPQKSGLRYLNLGLFFHACHTPLGASRHFTARHWLRFPSRDFREKLWGCCMVLSYRQIPKMKPLCKAQNETSQVIQVEPLETHNEYHTYLTTALLGSPPVQNRCIALEKRHVSYPTLACRPP